MSNELAPIADKRSGSEDTGAKCCQLLTSRANLRKKKPNQIRQFGNVPKMLKGKWVGKRYGAVWGRGRTNTKSVRYRTDGDIRAKANDDNVE